MKGIARAQVPYREHFPNHMSGGKFDFSGSVMVT